MNRTPRTTGRSSTDQTSALVIPELVASKDVAKVKAETFERYGFVPTDEYCRDLIVLVEQMLAQITALTEPRS